MTVPTPIATRPAGTLPGRRKRPIRPHRMNRSDVKPISGLFENRGERDGPDEHQSDAAERAQHARARRDPLEERADDGAERRDDAAHEARADADLPCQQGIARRPVDRADDAKEIDEHHRRRDAVGQGGHVLAVFVGDPFRHGCVDRDPGEDRDGGTRNDAPKDDLGGHLEDELANGGQDQKIDEVVRKQRPERVEIIPVGQFVAVCSV